jgi:hypothetical protein
VLPRDPHISPTRILEWQWKRPLAAILQFAGRSIDEVAGSPRVAAEVRTLWKTQRASEGLAARRAEEERIDMELWWRAMGSPVSCPVCGAADPCACARKKLTFRTEREWTPVGEPWF